MRRRPAHLPGTAKPPLRPASRDLLQELGLRAGDRVVFEIAAGGAVYLGVQRKRRRP